MKIALAQINPIIGSFQYNTQKILECIKHARQNDVELLIFPEMAICGYPPLDLLLLRSFIEAITKSLSEIIEACQDITVVIGCVRENVYGGEKNLLNSAAIISNRELIGFQDKMLLPDYDVFSERRYFEPGPHIDVWSLCGKKVAVTICEDLWQHPGFVEYSNYPCDPVALLEDKKPDLVINLSASPYYIGRNLTRFEVAKAAALTLNCPVLVCNQVGANTSLIFDGTSFFCNKMGELVLCAKSFEEDFVILDSEQEYPSIAVQNDLIEDLFQALVLGIRDYFSKLGMKKACFGLSGGIDSAVVAVLAKEALGAENVIALALPSRFSSSEGMKDALTLVDTLGIEFHEISIEQPYESLLDTLSPFFEHREPDVTEENLQARIRGILLMAFSNKFGYLLLSTGNKSEMAMGYATLYGDMCGGLGVLNDVTKEQVYALAHFMNREKELIPRRIITKPPSAELAPNQKDTDSLPEYPIVDAVLKGYVEEHLSLEQIAQKNQISLEIVKQLVRKIHLNEYKRRQAPPGLRVTKKAFTVGRHFPIVQHWNMEI